MSNCGRTYEVINCTRKVVFNSSLRTIPIPKILVSSVLANFLCDACTSDADALTAGNGVITEHIETLNSYSLSNPDVRIAVAPPLPRTVPDWFSSYLPVFSTFLFHEISRMANSNLKYLAPFVAGPSFFESDGVHLNADAGATFIRYLVSSADLLFPQEGDDAGTASQASHVEGSGPEKTLTLTQLSQDVDELRANFKRRRLQDNLVFARIKEDRDFEINKAREDRCTISGLAVRSAPPSEPLERKEFFKKLISDLVIEALPDVDVPPQVLDVIVNMRYGRGPPFFEVKFESVASSLSFRIAASKLAKAGTGSFQGVFVSNTVNLSTRIRIDIMKLLSKRLTTTTEFSYVQGFSSRPTLHYLMRAVDPTPGTAAQTPTIGTGRSYTFTECMERWGDLLPAHSLEPIRRKAVQAFSGCLEQYFVVLCDRVPEVEADIFSRLLPSGPHLRGPRPTRGSASNRRQYRPARGRPPPSSRSATTSSSSQPPDSVPLTAPSVPPPSLKRGPSPSGVEVEPSKKK